MPPDDSIASPILRFRVQALLEQRLNARTIVRVNPVKPEWRMREVLIGLNSIRALNLWRALDNPRRRIEPPASSTTESLHLEQKGLAASQRILGGLSVVDVGPDGVPPCGAIVVITDQDGSHVTPSIDAVRTPQAQLEFQRLAGRERALLCIDEGWEIVGMHSVERRLLHLVQVLAAAFLGGPA